MYISNVHGQSKKQFTRQLQTDFQNTFADRFPMRQGNYFTASSSPELCSYAILKFENLK